MSAQHARPEDPRRRAPIAITIGVVAVLVIAFFVFVGPLRRRALVRPARLPQRAHHRSGSRASSCSSSASSRWPCPSGRRIQIAYRTRPVYAKLNSQLDRYQQVIEPLRRLAMYGIPVVLGIFAGVSTVEPLGAHAHLAEPHPVRHERPAVRLRHRRSSSSSCRSTASIVGFASAVVLLSLLARHRDQLPLRRHPRERPRGRHLEVGAHPDRRHGRPLPAAPGASASGSTSTRRSPRTARSSPVPATPTSTRRSPVAQILAGDRRRSSPCSSSSPPSSAAGACRSSAPRCSSSSSLIIGSLYPWIIQRFQVDPSARSLEAPYIERNIDLTRDGLRRRRHRGRSRTRRRPTPSPARCASDAETTANIRIMDPLVISPAFQQLEQFRQYYQFPDAPRRRPLRRSTARRRTPSSRCATCSSRASATPRPGSTRTSSTRTATASSPRTATSARSTASPCSSQSGIPSTGVARRLRAARLLRRGLAGVLDRRRARGRRRRRARLPGRRRERPADPDHLRGRRRAEARQHLHEARLRAEVPVGADLPLRRGQRRLADPLRPRPDRAREEGRAVPHARLRHVPVGRRRHASCGSSTATRSPTSTRTRTRSA